MTPVSVRWGWRSDAPANGHVYQDLKSNAEAIFCGRRFTIKGYILLQFGGSGLREPDSRL